MYILSFNRTILELKLYTIRWLQSGNGSFNRTILELKFAENYLGMYSFADF